MANYKVGAARDLPIDKTTAWDGAAAKSAMFSACGFDGDAPNSAKVRRGFLVYDADAPKLKGSYGLPFASMKDGTMTAMMSGLRAAASRLPQKQGLSPEVQKQARSVIDAYRKKAGVPVTKFYDGMDLRAIPEEYHAEVLSQNRETVILPTSAHIQGIRSLKVGVEPDDEQLALIRGKSADPTIWSETMPYVFPTVMSNGKPDSYGTRMMKSSLQNFADDATEGRALLVSHNSRELPIGKSYMGRFVGGQGDGMARMEADWYMRPGWKPGPVGTDEVYQSIRDGTVSDTSVGFMGGQIRCSFCGGDMVFAGGWRRGSRGDSSICYHFPGFDYPVLDKAGKETAQREVAYGDVHDARLSEGSLVYDGATPGAGVLKAKRAIEAGILTRAQIAAVEAHYRIRLSDGRQLYPSAALPKEGTMDDVNEEREAATCQHEEEMRANKGFRTALDSIIASVRGVLGDTAPADAAAGVIALAAEVKRLQPMADDGKAYRTSLLEDAITAGKRALGTDFAEETYRGILTGAPIESLKRAAADWKRIGDANNPGGRLTRDDAQPGNGVAAKSGIPDAAFRSR